MVLFVTQCEVNQCLRLAIIRFQYELSLRRFLFLLLDCVKELIIILVAVLSILVLVSLLLDG